MKTQLTNPLTPQEQAERERLQRILDDLNGQIEAELRKLSPLLGEEVTTILALELDIGRVRMERAL